MMIIERLKSIPSTQDYIKKYIPKRQNAVVVAEEQTAGKGTKGRTFISEKGGLYVSKLHFHEFLPAKDCHQIMVNTAMAVVKTLLAFGVDARIKWPNDIWVNNKKICGILTQNSFKGEFVDYSLVGIGVNLNNDIAKEIVDIAISLKQATQKEVDGQAFLLTLLHNLNQTSLISDYKAYNLVLGKQITVCKDNQNYSAIAVDILQDGALLLDNGEKLYAGELNVKISL